MVAGAAQPPIGKSSEPGFELEQVVAVDGRVRVSGWWHGVRGRRFIRPSLTAVGARSRTRALAELEHKPWAATDDGQPWLAEFVWEQPLHDVEALELAVAPDLAVRIPAPGGPASGSDAARARPVEAIVERPKDRRVARVASSRGALTPGRPARPRVEASRSDALRIARVEQQRDRAVAARDEALAERDRVVEEHDQVVAERGRLREERDEALARATKLVAERDHAVSAARRLSDARDRAARERDAARVLRESAEAERDALGAEREALRSERDRLIRAGDQARAERNGLLAQHARLGPERERLARERDRALAQCDEMAAERDRHRDARDEALAERDRTMGELERLRRERDEARADVRRLSRDTQGLAQKRERVGSFADSGPRAPRERAEAGADVQSLRSEPPSPDTESTRPHVLVGPPNDAPAVQRPAAAGQTRPTRQLAARAAALAGVLAVIAIVVVIVLSR